MMKLNYDEHFTFRIDNADKLDYSYFPLTNGFNLKGSINPSLKGDLKLDQNHFALLPISEDDLKNSLYGRNVFFNVDGDVYSLNGMSPFNQLNREEVSIEGGFLYYKVQRKNRKFITNSITYCPYGMDNVELTKINLRNISEDNISVRVCTATPLYCRSADTIRDHRHVTALLNKATLVHEGIINKPTLLFDEVSHLKGETVYGFFARCSKGNFKNYWPTIEDFCQAGTNLAYPKAITESLESPYKINDTVAGYELLGGLEYSSITLLPNESLELVMMIGIGKDNNELISLKHKYLDFVAFDNYLEDNKIQWQKRLSSLNFNLHSREYNGWLKWVSLQPILRRIFGCSFLPHHDYGKGGKGWRDLWQDCLALLYMEPVLVEDLLLNNFLGVRIDGSNATIIGANKGEFKADRNAITRVWSDHGVWPFISVERYLNISGNLSFLMTQQGYYFDKFSHYTKKVNHQIDKSSLQQDAHGKEYQGTILEHLIIQNVVAFYNVGSHGNLKLENADWNDGLDMASINGESVAFTALYGSNLESLGKLILHAKFDDIYLLEELSILLNNTDFSVENKTATLKSYFDAVEGSISGNQMKIDYLTLANLLIKMGESFKQQVRINEWMEKDEEGYFCSYYDNDSRRLDDINNGQMMLSGQVFPLMGKVASAHQIKNIIIAADKYLYSPAVGGYRLNTNFNEVKFNMGRLFGFAYGHKENGAMFSHMAIMYANGLYTNNMARAGDKVLKSIFRHLTKLQNVKIYPGIPEYIDIKGRGMYHYLTGSASWLILTIIEEVFGIKWQYGKLTFRPRLLKDDFIDDRASITTLINDQLVSITYINEDKLDYGKYQVKEIYVDGIEITDELDKHLFNCQKIEVILK